MKNFLFLLAMAILTTASCRPLEPSPQTEIQELAYDKLGVDIFSNNPIVHDITDIYYVGCFNSNDFLDFYQIYSTDLEPVSAPVVIPAFTNYYQHNPELASAENLTLVDGIRIQSSDGTFNYDTSDFVFNWYVNDILVHNGFHMPYATLLENFGCDGIYEFGLEIEHAGFRWYREQPAFINFNELSSCPPNPLMDVTQFDVFYDFWPEGATSTTFMISNGYRFDFDKNQSISQSDLLSFASHYGQCL